MCGNRLELKLKKKFYKPPELLLFLSAKTHIGIRPKYVHCKCIFVFRPCPFITFPRSIVVNDGSKRCFRDKNCLWLRTRFGNTNYVSVTEIPRETPSVDRNIIEFRFKRKKPLYRTEGDTIINVWKRVAYNIWRPKLVYIAATYAHDACRTSKNVKGVLLNATQQYFTNFD